MISLIQDLKYAVRTLTKSPAFSAIAIATLALGIGANAAIFALVDRVMLRALPVRDPGELVLMRSPGPTSGHIWSDGDNAASFSHPMYRNLAARGGIAFSGVLAEFPFEASLSAGGQTERARGELVSGSYFPLLGVAPSVGRVLSVDDDLAPGARPVAVLSHGYWSRRFGNDPAVLNKTIVVNGSPLTVVGVARAGFSGIQPGRPADVFVPIMMKAQMTPFWNGLDDPKDYWLQLVGRLKPGMSRERAETAIQTVYRPLLQDLSPQMTEMNAAERQRFEARRLVLQPGSVGRTQLRSGFGTPLLSLMGMVALVLLIACSNLAGLLAARGAARQKEYGIRLAIGASRMQLVRQSIVECLLYSVLGGALGLLVAGWTLHALMSAFPADADLRLVAAEIDPRVLGFAALVSLAAGLLFGISPALRAARLDPARTLAGQGRGTVSASGDILRFRRWLVTGQVALTLVLLVVAGLFVDSLRNLGRVELGFKPDHVVGFSIDPSGSGYAPARTAALARSVSERVAALPGVSSVSAAELATMTGDDWGSDVTVDGARPSAPGESDRVRRNGIGPDYFATLGIPLVAGREFAWRDDAASPRVAVVNESFARRYFGAKNPVGASLAFGGGTRKSPPVEIIGVVRDSKASEVVEKDQRFAYTPYLQDPRLDSLTFYVRSRQEPGGLASSLRGVVKGLDPDLPVFGVKTLTAQIEDSLVTSRLIVFLSAAFGGLAALLAAIGIYGVLAFAVAQRRQEIAVRVALGADPPAVRRMILREVARFLWIGAAIGIPAAYALGRAVSSILYGVGAAEPRVFAAGIALMAIVALAAAYPPAIRAARTNAIDALRNE
ncbi:MAG: ABC transporter permease [Acidobacteriota bacterium]